MAVATTLMQKPAKVFVSSVCTILHHIIILCAHIEFGQLLVPTAVLVWCFARAKNAPPYKDCYGHPPSQKTQIPPCVKPYLCETVANETWFQAQPIGAYNLLPRGSHRLLLLI